MVLVMYYFMCGRSFTILIRFAHTLDALFPFKITNESLVAWTVITTISVLLPLSVSAVPFIINVIICTPQSTCTGVAVALLAKARVLNTLFRFFVAVVVIGTSHAVCSAVLASNREIDALALGIVAIEAISAIRIDIQALIARAGKSNTLLGFRIAIKL